MGLYNIIHSINGNQSILITGKGPKLYGVASHCQVFLAPWDCSKGSKNGFDQTSEYVNADAIMRKIIHSLWMSSVNHV